MEGRSGGRELIEKLEQLRSAIQNYYGMLGEIKQGLKPENVFERPDVLEIMEVCRSMGISRVDADYEHQPYIWMLEFKTAVQEELAYAARSASGVNNGVQTTGSN